MKTTISRLKLAVLDREKAWGKKILKKDLAAAAGVSSSAVTNWWNNENTELEARCVFGLAKFLEISPEWLQSGRGKMPDLPGQHSSASAELSKKSHIQGMIGGSFGAGGSTLDERVLPNPTSDEHVLVLQLNIEAACGEGRFHDHVIVDGGKTFAKSELRDLGVPEHAARLIFAVGGSMSPKIQDGRAVLINLIDREPRDNKIYAICMPDDGLVLKRLVWDFHPAVGQQTWIIRSDNPDKAAFPDKILPPDDRTMIAGRAVWTDSLL